MFQVLFLFFRHFVVFRCGSSSHPARDCPELSSEIKQLFSIINLRHFKTPTGAFAKRRKKRNKTEQWSWNPVTPKYEIH